MASITSGVEKYVLENGLRVLAREQRSAPVTAVVAHVHIGYFNEPDRWNGISHVIEHMLFKGTRNRPGKEQIASDVRAIGGSINAGTYYEDTTYYITVPSAHTESAVEILADMLRNSLIDPHELAKELEVIIQESKQKRDNPRAMLFETMYEKAFDHHRIRRWRIGDDATLSGFRREDLQQFISDTYVPENVAISIVGDISPGDALRFVERHWGDMPAEKLNKDLSPPEPERREFRYHRMTADIQQRLVALGFPGPPVLSDESPALMILDSILSDGRSSRFYRSLKEERRLVNSASAGYEGFERLGLFTFGADFQGEDPLPAVRGLFEESNRLIEEGVGAEEIERVKTRIDSRWVFAQEEAMGLARTLSSYEALGGFELADTFRSRLEAVQADEVTAVAAKYLRPESATLVEYLPRTSEAPEPSRIRVWEAINRPVDLERRAGHPRSRFPVPSDNQVSSLERPPGTGVTVVSLPGGATLIHRMRSELPITAVHLLFPGGRIGERASTAGLTNLLLKSSLKGTRSFEAAALAQRIESLGTSIGLTLGADYVGYSMKLLSGRAEEGFALLKEVLCFPTFPDAEIEKEKESIYAELRRQRDSMFSRSLELYNKARFGSHPYGLPPAGEETAVAGMTDEMIRGWHRQWIRSAGAVISIVGSIAAEEALELFSEAVPFGEPMPSATPPEIAADPAEEVESVDRQQSACVMGFDGASISSEDRHSLDLIAEITSGLAGRFFQAVRGDNALAYAVTSFNRPRRDFGTFGTYTATSPENEFIARDIILTECARLASIPVGAEELRDAKAAIRGEYAIHTQTFGAQAAELAVNRLYGLPLEEPDRYLARIESTTPEEIMDAASRYLRPDRYWLGAVRGSLPAPTGDTSGGIPDDQYRHQ